MSDPAAARETTLRSDLESLRINRGPGGGTSVPRKSHRRRNIALLVVLAAVVAVIIGRARSRAIPVTVVTATRSEPGQNTTAPVLSGSGYVVTGDRYVSIGVRVPGRIDRYFVEEGQDIHKGDPLVQLDDRDYRAALARTEAGLAVARANLGLAEAELNRGYQLRSQNVNSQQELDVQINKAAVARATVAQLEAELQQARVNLEYTLLRAPSDGVVLAKLKEVGEIAVPGGFAGSGDLIRLANLTDLRAEVDVNEADLSRVHMSQPAEVTPDAYPELHYAAEVVKMYPQVDRQKGTLKIEVHIPKPDDKLLPDMSVRVTFLEPLPAEVAQKPLVILPGAAVRKSPNGAYVWTVTDHTARRVSVDTVGPLGDRVRISQGLSGGESVVVSDEAGLVDGSAVVVK